MGWSALAPRWLVLLAAAAVSLYLEAISFSTQKKSLFLTRILVFI
jgi:hypothetical protein